MTDITQLINETYAAVDPVAEEVGEFLIAGSAAFGIASTAKSFRYGTSLRDQVRNAWNYVIGAGVGLTAAIAADMPEGVMDLVAGYTGAAALGFGAGAVLDSARQAITTHDNFGTCLQTGSRQGGTTGAVIGMAAYAALQILDHYL